MNQHLFQFKLVKNIGIYAEGTPTQWKTSTDLPHRNINGTLKEKFQAKLMNKIRNTGQRHTNTLKQHLL